MNESERVSRILEELKKNAEWDQLDAIRQHLDQIMQDDPRVPEITEVHIG
jgi:hypothetical protein